jgi:hypothetical protein
VEKTEVDHILPRKFPPIAKFTEHDYKCAEECGTSTTLRFYWRHERKYREQISMIIDGYCKRPTHDFIRPEWPYDSVYVTTVIFSAPGALTDTRRKVDGNVGFSIPFRTTDQQKGQQ